MTQASFIGLVDYQTNCSVRLRISEISRYFPYDEYRPGNGSMVILKDGTMIHTTSTCDQIDEAIQ
jgi:hypothetical protein